jgi:hypothetical protein
MPRKNHIGDTDGNTDSLDIGSPSVEWAYLVSITRSEIR